MNKIAAILMVIIIGLSILLLQQQKTITQLKQDLAALKAQIEESDEDNPMIAENKQLKAEITKLQSNQRELIRLRGEVGVLRKQTQQPISRAAVTQEFIDTNDLATLAETNSFPTNIYTVKTQVKVGNGQTLVTGGWQILPGKRCYMLITPQISGGDASAPNIQVNSLFIEGPDNLLTEAGLNFGPAGRDSEASRIIEGQATEAMINRLLSSAGVDVLTSPAITTSSGRKSMLNAAEVNSDANPDRPVFHGPIIQITPTWSADSQTIELDLIGQITRPGL